jgi:hypothetical protein
MTDPRHAVRCVCDETSAKFSSRAERKEGSARTGGTSQKSGRNDPFLAAAARSSNVAAGGPEVPVLTSSRREQKKQALALADTLQMITNTS